MNAPVRKLKRQTEGDLKAEKGTEVLAQGAERIENVTVETREEEADHPAEVLPEVIISTKKEKEIKEILETDQGDQTKGLQKARAHQMIQTDKKQIQHKKQTR
jgi:hypothetical protein